jgi:hypothetical protein
LYKQTFIIKKLTGIWLQESNLPPQQNNSGDINNIIIELEGVAGTNPNAPEYPAIEFRGLFNQNIRPGTVGLRVKVNFESNEDIYETDFTIRNFTALNNPSNMQNLYNNIHHLQFKLLPKTGMDMVFLPTRFLQPQEYGQLAKPITLESIATFIDKKIDKQDQSMDIWSEADETKLLKMLQDRAEKQK